MEEKSIFDIIAEHKDDEIEGFEATVEVYGEEFGIVVYPKLTIKQRITITKGVVSDLFTTDGTGAYDYFPSFKSLCFWSRVLSEVTDIPVLGHELEVWTMIENSNVVRVVMDMFKHGELEGLMDDVDEAISFYKKKYVAMKESDSALSSIGGMLDGISDKIATMDNQELLKALSDLGIIQKDALAEELPKE